MRTPTLLSDRLAPVALAALVAAVSACAADTLTTPSAGHHAHAAVAAGAEAEPARLGGGSEAARGAALAAARAATARYHRVDAAEADGFANTVHCVATPVAGMGVHFVNGARVADGAIDAARPEVLVYEPQSDGGMRLVAVEYMVPKPMWDAAHPGTRPTLFGATFEDGPMNSYALHAWVWRHNADGMFAAFNPAVVCPADVAQP
jgi:hypothetical protein